MNARKLAIALLRNAQEDLLRGGALAADAWAFLMLPADPDALQWGWTAEDAAQAANLSLPALRRALIQRGYGFPPSQKLAIPAPCIPKTRRTQAGWIRCACCWRVSPVWDIYRAKTCIPCGRRTPRWYQRKREHAA